MKEAPDPIQIFEHVLNVFVKINWKECAAECEKIGFKSFIQTLG